MERRSVASHGLTVRPTTHQIQEVDDAPPAAARGGVWLRRTQGDFTPGIFISYRREDAPGHAGRLYDVLSRRFGEEQVFMDLGMELGIDFVEHINKAVGSCRLLVAVIGPRWTSTEDAHGRRRLDDPADFIRVEVETGLRRPEVRVVPVLVQGARMPDADELPASLAELARLNALEVSDARWGYDVDRLTSTVERVLGVRAEPSEEARKPDLPDTHEKAGAARADVERPHTDAPVDGRRRERPISAGWVRRHVRVAVPLLVIGVAVAIGAFILAGRDQSNSSEGEIHSDTEPYVSKDEIELSGLRATSEHTDPEVGDQIEINFSLKNVGSESVTFGETFIGARDPDDGHKDFGSENADKKLAPGKALEVSRSIDVNAPGSWKFWPCYNLSAPEPSECPDDWRSFEVRVVKSD